MRRRGNLLYLRQRIGSIGLRLSPAKLRHVGPGRQLDSDWISRALLGIVQPEPLPDLAGFDPDGGVVARFIAGGTAEDFDADGPLLQHVFAAAERVFHY